MKAALLKVLREELLEYLQRKLGDSLLGKGGARVVPEAMYIHMGIGIAVEARTGHEGIEEAKVECNKRLEEGAADLCIAVAYDEEVGRARSHDEVEERLRALEHKVSVVAPLYSEDLGSLMLRELAEALKRRNVYERLLEREAVEEIAGEIKEVLDRVSRLERELLEGLERAAEETLALRGREEGAAREAKVKSLLFVIANAMIVHEALASSPPALRLPSLEKIEERDPVGWLLEAWGSLREGRYGQIFELATRALGSLPRGNERLNSLLLALASKAVRAVAEKAIFRHDLAGRLYHRLLFREVAKGLATYYTSLPASAILSSLALDLLETDWGRVGEVGELRIGDLSCGSGTLLSAVYSEIVNRHVTEAPGSARELDALHKVLLEQVLYGFDVVDYAVHLAAATLVMRRPSVEVNSTNIFAVPLGVVNGRPFLGSLSLSVVEGKVRFPKIRTLLGEESTPLTKATTEGSASQSLHVDLFDLVIMNPPFARSGNAGHSVLFGHMAGAQRREVLEELRRLGDSMQRSLGLRGGFGRAGLAAYFTLLSYTVLKEGGVAALVLPRVFLSGSDWEPVREFLLSKGEVHHVVISDDPKAKWAWSENTGLSEMLLVYRKGRRGASGNVIVTYVRKFPSSSLKAELYARRIKEAGEELRPERSGFSPTEEVFVKGGGEEKVPVMFIYAVRSDVFRRAAEEAQNLNVAVGFHHSLLSAVAFELFFERKFLSSPAPLVPLKQYVEQLNPGKDWEGLTGYDVRVFRDMCLKGSLKLHALRNLSRETMSSLELPRGVLEQIHTNQRCASRAGRLVVPGIGRFGLSSVGVIALFHENPILSDVAWTVPLGAEDAKIQALWLNSTPGLIHFLSLRQDSSGSYMPLKKSSLGSLLLVDVKGLRLSARQRLLSFFEENSGRQLGQIGEQLAEALRGHGFRHELDKLILAELFGINAARAEAQLANIYERLLGETLIQSPRA
ncbi:MAG: hypothetical protein ABDH61_02100 [Acidilobaceae archaeon]